MTHDAMERHFPNLASAGYAVTSEQAASYNCLAWALGDTQHWWEPINYPFGYYWPRRAPRDNTVQAWTVVFQLYGFELCDTADLEPDYEKVAIYALPDGTPGHAALQLADGTWTSKLGRDEDISHRTLSALEGDEYGTVVRFLRRFRATAAGPS